MKCSFYISLQTAIIIFCLISGLVFAQEDFYYLKGEKIPLDISTENISIKFQNGFSLDRIHDLIQSDPVLSKLKPLRPAITRGFYTISLKGHTDIKKLIQRLKQKPEVDIVSPVYLVDGLEAIPFDHFIVQFEPSVTRTAIEELIQQHSVEIMDVHMAAPNLYTFRITSDSDLSVVDMANLYFEKLPAEWSLPDFIVPIELFSTPNDPYFQYQYYFHNTGQTGGIVDADIDAPEAWSISTGSSSIIVAVIDEGGTSHNDLPSDRIAPGYDYFYMDPDPSPGGNEAHGMACAGIVGASQNNSDGISGLAPDCRIMNIRIFDEWQNGTSISNVANSVDYAWQNGADVISGSWGYTTSNPNHPLLIPIRDAINRALTQGRNGKGSVVVFAAGNTANRSSGYYGYVTFPANVPGVVAVGATDKSNNIQNYSPRDAELAVIAPSGNTGLRFFNELFLRGDVWSVDIAGHPGWNFGDYGIGSPTYYLYYTWDPPGGDPYPPGNYTAKFGGTSASCPQVAGIAALILSVNPELEQSQVSDIIKQCADDMGPSGYDQDFGYGRANAGRSVLLSLPYLASFSADATSNNNGHRMVKYSGEYHLVYESTGDIFYTKSQDMITWEPLLIVNEYHGEGHNPSITVNADGVHIVWYEINDDKTEIYYRHIGGLFYWDPLYEFSPAKEVHPVIETNSQETGALRWIVTEGSDGLYYIVLNSLSLHAIPNSTSKSKFPSLQMRTNTFGVAYEEDNEIYYIRYDPLYNYWYNPQLISSQSWQSKSHHPCVTGEYTSSSDYWIAWDDQGPNPSWETIVYRSETGTYYSFSSWLKFYYYPSIRSDEAYPDPNITLSFEEWYNHDVYYTNFNPSTGRWDLPILISTEGEKPNIALNYREITPEPSDIVWTSEAEVPYRIQTFSPGSALENIENQTIVSVYSRQINFDLAKHPAVTSSSLNLSGEISVELFPYQTTNDTLPFEAIIDSASANKFFSSKPFTATADSLKIHLVIKGKNIIANLPNPNAHRFKLLEYNLKKANNGQLLTSLFQFPIQTLTSIGQDSFVVEKTIAMDLSAFQGQKIIIEEEFLKRIGHFNPTFIEKYNMLPQDSLQMRKSAPPLSEGINAEILPNQFALLQNYPNPFNPTTTIHFGLPADCHVKLMVYNINGELITELINNTMKKGFHEMNFDGSNLSSGVYLYRIVVDSHGEAGSFVQTRKMMLIK